MTLRPATFGRVVATARKQKQISQKELAAMVVKDDGSPISPQYLNDIEHGRRNPPSEPLLDQFAEILGLTREYLYYVAGQFPSEFDPQSEPEQVQAAFRAFRRAFDRKRR